MNAAVESLLEFWEQVSLILKEDWAWKVVSSTHLYCIVNCYAVFSVMTLYRHEIIIEGWDETKKEWREYQLWYKPGLCHSLDLLIGVGEVKRAPPFLFPGHLPRLDWMLWFCGLRTDYWTRDVMVKLLKGSQQTLTMFQYNPFPGTLSSRTQTDKFSWAAEICQIYEMGVHLYHQRGRGYGKMVEPEIHRILRQSFRSYCRRSKFGSCRWPWPFVLKFSLSTNYPSIARWFQALCRNLYHSPTLCEAWRRKFSC